MQKYNKLANAIRFLAMDAVEAAHCGHPGMPMGMADVATVLWRDFLRHNPNNPMWKNRDRFILSNGHGCLLQYALLHLTGYALSVEDLRQFRQWGSKTPGHPEYGLTPGVEATTGPLGQGLAMAVGMAFAAKQLAAKFNQPNFPIIDHDIYVVVGDGCLMEGISHEASSLAGTLGLGRLIAIYDQNGISIDGSVNGWFTEDVSARFRAYGWHVIDNVDGHNIQALRGAFQLARAQKAVPTLICTKTTIGFGAPNLANTATVHGQPLGAAEIASARESLNWPHEPFFIPDEIYEAWDARTLGAEREETWNQLWQAYSEAHPKLAAELMRRWSGNLPERFNESMDALSRDSIHQSKPRATRVASKRCLAMMADNLPELVGGSADLSGSNGTLWSDDKDALVQSGRYVFYGVREFAMGAMMNGMALYGGVIPFGGTFLVFADYARNAIRLSAMMGLKVIYVLTHDSIGLGEDGPTHQPIEHLTMLRATPGLETWRPCDDFETAVAWSCALQRQGPSVLCLSRQALPAQQHVIADAPCVKNGAYVLYETGSEPAVVFLASGSEVTLACQAAKQLNISARVVSVPCYERFAALSDDKREELIPSHAKVIALEAGHPMPWYPFVRSRDHVAGLSEFGHSAPAQEVYAHMGLTVERLIALAMPELETPKVES